MDMGLIPCPSIFEYWSTNALYKTDLVSSIMSRNRFQILLRFIHFPDSSNDDRVERSRKFISILTMLQTKFCEAYKPGTKMTLDETMIPFRGRLSFLQYLPCKSHKYGIKMFRLCNTDGYTFRMQVYTGKAVGKSRNLPSDIVMKLAEPYLDEGRALATDNYFTSVDLARELLLRRTNLIGTLRKNRKHLPPCVVNARLCRDEIIGKVSEDGIVVGKWRDKRDVLFLTTMHDLTMVDSEKLRIDGLPRVTPVAILDYNKCKQGVDLSDQLASYQTPLRKTIRW